MDKNTIKEFWNDHKTDIITIAAYTVAGGVVGGLVSKHLHKESLGLVNQLRRYNYCSAVGGNIFSDLCKIQEGCNSMQLFKSMSDESTIANLGKHILEWCDEANVDPNTKITGLAIFLDMKE